jgi:hypothetical protein
VETALTDTQPKKPVTFKRVNYSDLNSRQQENFNFQKVAAHLADFGYNCLRLSDDWNGADFIACHVDGIQFLKIQLKGRLTFQQSYRKKDLHIAFHREGIWYVYPHDELLSKFLALKKLEGTRSWEKQNGGYSWGKLSKEIEELLKPYIV